MLRMVQRTERWLALAMEAELVLRMAQRTEVRSEPGLALVTGLVLVLWMAQRTERELAPAMEAELALRMAKTSVLE